MQEELLWLLGVRWDHTVCAACLGLCKVDGVEW